MFYWIRLRDSIFSAFVLAFIIFLFFINFNCFASDTDPSLQKYIEKFKNLEVIQKNGAKYFDKAKFWEKEGIQILYLEGSPFA
jgi:hypothetical protein